MALERDNPAERLARIDKLVAENKLTARRIARLQASLTVVSLPQGPSLDTRDLREAETRTRSAIQIGPAGPMGSQMARALQRATLPTVLGATILVSPL